MSKIRSISAREILSSSGLPTLEVKVILESGIAGTASVPYGVSAGTHEAVTLFDNDPKRFNGRGMLKACHNVNRIISPKLAGKEASHQAEIDELMISLDGTPAKSRLGGNAILGVSLAVARASALDWSIPLYHYIRKCYKIKLREFVLPNPMMVVIEGGKHADNSTDFQEYLISPLMGNSAREEIRAGIECCWALREIVKKKGFSSNVGNEGAFAPAGIKTNEEPFRLIAEAVAAAGYTVGKDIGLSFDGACSELYRNGKYFLKSENRYLTPEQMIFYFTTWVNKIRGLITVEDPLHEDQWEGWKAITQKLGRDVAIVGDDLLVTNEVRLKKAIETKAANAILIKLNQAGTLTETIQTCMLAHKNKFLTIVSHRGGGETNDSFMIDLAVAVNAGFVKVGPTRGERVAKYNRLMEIEQELGKKARVAGRDYWPG
ncbi:phosphopyruvate hydratase [Candidatus Woesearchaeota archaeon]|nr:phosphopyruvate hydratase [Candidatus Woesearchaeota archaeon]